MATTKVVTAIWSGTTLSASSADTTATVVVLDDGYGASLHIKLTNGSTAPTIAAQLIVEVSADNSERYEFGFPFVGNLVNSGVESWGDISIPIGIEYLRLVGGSNTGQDVTVDADISEVTALS